MHEPKTERSCGAVVFTRDRGSVQYLIIQSLSGAFGFPKGHMEPGEREEETALREIAEETGLSVTLLEGFRAEDRYTFSLDGKPISKHVTYFLAEFSRQIPTPQETELSGVFLTAPEDAMAALSFESGRRILEEARAFLQRRGIG